MASCRCCMAMWPWMQPEKQAIVSGDQLVSYLARALQAEVVAVGSNVDGVLFSGKPLAEITRE